MHLLAPIHGQAKGIKAKELQAVSQCGGGKHHVYLFSNFGVEFCYDERVVEIKTKQMEADKTRKEEAEIMNGERRNCKGTGSQRGSVGSGPGGEWPE